MTDLEHFLAHFMSTFNNFICDFRIRVAPPPTSDSPLPVNSNSKTWSEREVRCCKVSGSNCDQYLLLHAPYELSVFKSVELYQVSCMHLIIKLF